VRRLPILLAALALAACGGTEASAPESGPPPEGEAVSIAGTTLDGAELSVDQFRGKPVFINVWASW
jgi:hypothetical protein